MIAADQLAEILSRLFSGLKIVHHVKTQSGQRVVYFGRFEGDVLPERLAWGEIAIKVAKNLHPKELSRLQRESQVLRSIDSHFFPRLLHDEAFARLPGEEEDLPSPLYVTFEEKVDSAPLTQCKERFQGEKEAIALAVQLVEGLALLWSRKEKLIHRDLKPDNILIRPGGSPVIIDLGLLREEGSVGVTSAADPYGPCTPAYASPEQVKNDKQAISFRTDFHALGIILYELISGRNPFFCNGEKFREDVFNNVMTVSPESLSEQKLCSARCSALVDKLLKKEPYQRFRTVEALAAELQAIKEEQA